MKKVMIHPTTGQMKVVKVGFSWTMLFFGWFVPLFRLDWKWLLISILLSMITFGISWLVLPFFYNGRYIEDLLAKGWRFE